MRMICNLTVSVMTFAAMFLIAAPVLAQAPAEAMDTTVSAPASAPAGEMIDSAKAAGGAVETKAEEVTGAAGEAAKAKAEEATKAGAEETMQAQPAETPKTPPAATEEKPVNPNAPYEGVTFAEGEKPQIVMETSMGTIVLELWPDVAPKHCQSFAYLVNKGFYDSLTFHRIVPGFVIQGGDPLGNGTGGPGYNVPAEFSNKPHEDGVLSMARSTDPNSAGSQFFICLGRLASLDNKYTVFGKVVEGLDIVHKIEKAPVQGERPRTPVYMTKVSMKTAAGE